MRWASGGPGYLGLSAGVVFGVGELGQDVRRVGTAARREPTKLIQVLALACELNEKVDRVGTAA